jgi:hypothetical protein
MALTGIISRRQRPRAGWGNHSGIADTARNRSRTSASLQRDRQQTVDFHR